LTITYIIILFIEASLNANNNHPLLLLPLPRLDPSLYLGQIIALKAFFIKIQLSIGLLNLKTLQPYEAICLQIILRYRTILIELAATDFIDVFACESEFHIMKAFGREEDQIFQFKVLLAISEDLDEGGAEIVI
jgi:hypothetical protein